MPGLETAIQLEFEVYEAGNSDHEAAAQLAQAWQAAEHPRMLPLGPEEMSAHPMGLVAFLREGEDPEDERVFAGYNAVVHKYEDGTLEVGGLIVNPELRKRGIALAIKEEIVRRLNEVYPDEKIITFVNENSHAVNKRVGFEEVGFEEVPAGALDLCAACPSKTELDIGKICCDTPLALRRR